MHAYNLMPKGVECDKCVAQLQYATVQLQQLHVFTL